MSPKPPQEVAWEPCLFLNKIPTELRSGSLVRVRWLESELVARVVWRETLDQTVPENVLEWSSEQLVEVEASDALICVEPIDHGAVWTLVRVTVSCVRRNMTPPESWFISHLKGAVLPQKGEIMNTSNFENTKLKKEIFTTQVRSSP